MNKFIKFLKEQSLDGMGDVQKKKMYQHLKSMGKLPSQQLQFANTEPLLPPDSAKPIDDKTVGQMASKFDNPLGDPEALIIDEPSGDINGDGVVDTADLLAIIAAWGPCDGCPEDLTGNGNVGVEDLLIVISQWGGTEPIPEPYRSMVHTRPVAFGGKTFGSEDEMKPDYESKLRNTFENPYTIKGQTSDKLLHYTDDEEPGSSEGQSDGPIGWHGM